MKWNTTLKISRFFALAAIMLQCGVTSAQIEYRKLSGAGTALLDINDSGVAIKKYGVYNLLLIRLSPLMQRLWYFQDIICFSYIVKAAPVERVAFY